MYYNKKLSYRKQIARQLRTQYLEGIYSNSVTLKSERSLKVIQTAITRKLWCVSYSSSIVYGIVLYCLRATYWSKIAKFLYTVCI